MRPWDVLEIDPTREESVIKRAYAKKLRQHHPEEDPEGYQRLREAYDSALKQAKQLAAMPVAITHDLDDEDEDEEEWEEASVPFYPWLPDEDEVEQVLPTVVQHPVHALMEQIEELYDDFPARIEPKNWESILDTDVIWDVEHSQTLTDSMISFLEDYHHLPHSVWLVLDSVFHYKEDKETLLQRYPTYFIHYMLRQINGSMELRYDCFRDNERVREIDIEEYLTIRESAQERLMDRELELAGEDLEEAHEMFPDDPDLQLMRGKYFLEIGDRTKALECFDHVIALEPAGFDGHWHRAQILLDQERYEEALATCEQLQMIEPENIDVSCLRGRALIGQKRIEEARKQLKSTFDLDHFHFQTYIQMFIAANKHVYEQGWIDPAQIRKVRLNNLWFWIVMFMRFNWLYIITYSALWLLFDLHLLYTGLFLAVLLWNLLKMIKVYHAIST